MQTPTRSTISEVHRLWILFLNMFKSKKTSIKKVPMYIVADTGDGDAMIFVNDENLSSGEINDMGHTPNGRKWIKEAA